VFLLKGDVVLVLLGCWVTSSLIAAHVRPATRRSLAAKAAFRRIGTTAVEIAHGAQSAAPLLFAGGSSSP
jgi:hypothetical protein